MDIPADTSGQSKNNKGIIDTMMNKASNNNTPNPGHPNMKNVPVDRQKYYAFIPFTQSQKNLSNKEIQDALFDEGNIYYKRLNETGKAIEAFEEQLRRFPLGSLADAAAYNLWGIYGSK